MPTHPPGAARGRGGLYTVGLLMCAPALTWAAPQLFQINNESGDPVNMATVSVTVRGTRPSAAPGTSADMGQRNKAFSPGVLVVQTGTSVSFPNFDTVRHHVYSFSKPKTFEIKLYAGIPAAPVVFDKAGTATLGCNIHDRMIGYIHVVDTPYFGQTSETGKLALDLPPGEHTVRVWTPVMGEATPGVEQSFKTGGVVTLRVKG